jgi:hypothetical protein
MVDKGYMVSKAPPPSAFRTMVNRQVVPAAIDAAATVEAGLEQIALATRRWPLPSVAIAFGVGVLLATAVTARARDA